MTATASFLGPRERWSQAEIRLDDVGADLRATGQGVLVVRRCPSGGQQARYRLEVAPSVVQELLEKAAGLDVLSFSPNEARPVISVLNPAGHLRSVSNAGEPFDSLYQQLRGLTQVPANTPPEYEGPYPDPPLLELLEDYLRTQGVAGARHPSQPAVRFRSGPLICVGQARGERQLLVYCLAPVGVPPERRLPAAEFLTRANYGMAVGNFELDVHDGEVRFKTSVDSGGSELDLGQMRPLIDVALQMMRDYLPGLRAVIEGLSPEQGIAVVEGS